MIDRLEKYEIDWVHPMHGGSFRREQLPRYMKALRENEFAHNGMLLGREIAKAAPM